MAKCVAVKVPEMIRFTDFVEEGLSQRSLCTLERA
jgi:hypothetical protein